MSKLPLNIKYGIIYDTLSKVWPKLNDDQIVEMNYLLEKINDEENYNWTIEQELGMIAMVLMNKAEKYAFSLKTPGTFVKYEGVTMLEAACKNFNDVDDQGFEGQWKLDKDLNPKFFRFVNIDGPV